MTFDQLLNKQDQQLSKIEMQRVTGGFYDTGTCGLLMPSGLAVCDMSREEAESHAAIFGGPENGVWWCCDSCSQNGGNTSYC
ncbi:hypothetical protein [Pontibacter sp. G13]|uniref:hypothetical protein n=1 Tax=Pontibacter sp. G13 TaxID=3074898 RepID=UPI00288A0D79|nr:hypothetical protein [Pontibacter sp. G13]WNJ20369.1 hypothetical protein RJD25_07800 [Pontibacter sp. G13]